MFSGNTKMLNISYRGFAIVTMILYVVVAFKDPGYVTSYVLKGDEFEDDIEKMRKY